MKEFNYKINGAPYRVIINNTDNSTVQLEVNGTSYTVELEKKAKSPLSKIKSQPITTPTPQSVSTPLVTKPKSAATGKNVIKSPLPGVILDIRCQAGDVVKKGQTLMILEAMKMENNILASEDGKLAEILVQKGDSVLEGADLIVLA